MSEHPAHRHDRTSRAGAPATDPFGRPLTRTGHETDAFGRPIDPPDPTTAPVPAGTGSAPTAPPAEPAAAARSSFAPRPLGAPDGVVRSSPEQPAAAPASATMALVLGIGGLLFFPLLCSIPAWIVGARARRESRELPGRPGYGMATTGWILGIVSTVLWGLVGVLMVIGLVAMAGAWHELMTA